MHFLYMHNKRIQNEISNLSTPANREFIYHALQLYRFIAALEWSLKRGENSKNAVSNSSWDFYLQVGWINMRLWKWEKSIVRICIFYFVYFRKIVNFISGKWTIVVQNKNIYLIKLLNCARSIFCLYVNKIYLK